MPTDTATHHTASADVRPSLPSAVVARGLILVVRAYQVAVSPVLHTLAGPSCGCRFTPSCSRYAVEALRSHGALQGTSLAARRLLRCHPWHPGGHDPVP